MSSPWTRHPARALRSGLVARPVARLRLFVAALALLGLVVLLVAPVSRDGLRDALDPLGAVGAPVAFVPLSALLGALLVPGPILAGASGLLFGTRTGFVVTVAATVLSALLSTFAAQRAGRPGVEELDHPRIRRLERLLRRHGLAAVVMQRLAPAVPDAPCSYLYGLVGLPLRTVALGTLVGAAPRAFSYTAIGDGLGSGSHTIATIGVVTLVVGSLLGALVAGLLVRRAQAPRP